ncbi:hypothetical protein KGS74_02320 [Lacticaseibacillus casei]|uniref:hypothetical protein n=1 Tax=Lacticaseibacillus casei TaxID=1582 RepID=UPI001BCE31CE|nr:hypothetical protein [Lacticaseibacillus casei]QVI37835.1 hypothetical protein KGS74_02320 [Lacticaseibacillus casei]
MTKAKGIVIKNNLAEAMERCHFSVNSLSIFSGVSRSRIAALQKNRNLNVTLQTAVPLARTLGLPFYEIFTSEQSFRSHWEFDSKKLDSLRKLAEEEKIKLKLSPYSQGNALNLEKKYASNRRVSFSGNFHTASKYSVRVLQIIDFDVDRRDSEVSLEERDKMVKQMACVVAKFAKLNQIGIILVRLMTPGIRINAAPTIASLQRQLNKSRLLDTYFLNDYRSFYSLGFRVNSKSVRNRFLNFDLTLEKKIRIFE